MSRNGRAFSAALNSRYRINPHGGQRTLTLRVWLNPNGSRNLEYDPSMRIEVN
jgi:hypothetical protein